MRISSRLQNLSIKNRILLVALAPTIAFTFFASIYLYDTWHKSINMYNVERLAHLAPEISNLVHELQKERGASAGFLSSQGKQFADFLTKQRRLTDLQLKRLNAEIAVFDFSEYPQPLQQDMEAGQAALTKLQSARSNIDSFNYSVAQMAGYYTPTIRKLLSIIETMGPISNNYKITNQIVAYTNLLQAKERAGLERAMGAAGFSADQFSQKVYNKFVGLIAQQNAFIARFKVFASSEEVDFYETTLSGNVTKEVERLRKIAIDSHETGTTKNIDGDFWFGAITKKIDLLKKVEDKMSEDLVHNALSLKNSAKLILTVSLVAISILVLLGGLISYLAIRSLVKPICEMTTAMQKLADANLDIEIPCAKENSEIGKMAIAMHVFRENAVHRAASRKEITELNKTRRERQKHMENEIEAFREAVISLISSLTNSSEKLGEGSKELYSTATQTSEQVNNAASASANASTNVQAVASASEQLSAAVNEISRQILETKEMVDLANQATGETDGKISSLASSADKIGEVISLIQEIAEQTNLLALNATIEAARAGEAGKGFAVVASEVKALATQTAKATEAISEQIATIQNETEGSVKAIRGITERMEQVFGATEAIAAAVEQQGAATSEISNNIQMVAEGSDEVSQSVNIVSSAADATRQSSQNVHDTAKDISHNSQKLQKVIDNFLKEVIAA